MEKYSRWIQEQTRERSVQSLKEWLKEEVLIRVEAMEMTHGLVVGGSAGGGSQPTRIKHDTKDLEISTLVQTFQPKPRDQLGGKTIRAVNHPVLAATPHTMGCGLAEIFNRRAGMIGQLAKDKRLCFRCLAGDHQGRMCTRSQPCQIDGCRGNHHRLLHESLPVTESSSLAAREGVAPPERTPAPRTMTTHNPRGSEAYSLRTIPVWVKAQGKKIKVNAILDDASNESFLNEEVAGALGLKQSYQTVKVHVLNNSVETFQTMPLRITIESVNGQLTKEIEVKTCPRSVTGSYQVENWRERKVRWPHLVQCDFPLPAKDGVVDLLIGVDYADLHYSFIDIRGNVGEPVARLGPLGWTCIGPPDGKAQSGTRTHTIRTLFTKNAGLMGGTRGCCELDQTLKRFWEIESYGTEVSGRIVCTKEERLALETVSSSVRYSDGRYSVAVPWKEQRPCLPNNLQVAESRLRSTERNLKKSKGLVEPSR